MSLLPSISVVVSTYPMLLVNTVSLSEFPWECQKHRESISTSATSFCGNSPNVSMQVHGLNAWDNMLLQCRCKCHVAVERDIRITFHVDGRFFRLCNIDAI